jgi:membrane protease YdiL (CAAX protease family)
VNGVIFAAIHPQGIVGIPILTSLAIALTLIRFYRGSLWPPMVVHAVHNFGASMIGLLLLS